MNVRQRTAVGVLRCPLTPGGLLRRVPFVHRTFCEPGIAATDALTRPVRVGPAAEAIVEGPRG
jgi:hypothetical protein